MSNDGDIKGTEAREYMHLAAQQFVEHLDDIGAPNYLEIALTDGEGAVRCYVTIRRADGEDPLAARGRLKAENVDLRRRLATIARMAGEG
jgi:hypothetical protein